MAEVSFLPSELIKKKRNGFSLSTEEIEFFINGYTKGLIPDYQMSAMLMSIYFKGMTDVETLALTKSMLFSGTVIEFPDVKSFKVDKHSTGGVGDKTSLILGPIVAACGLSVPMISGRGLGHTGGTLDKLESIPGFNTQLNLEQFKHAITEHGICFIGQTKDICPADKKIYALRDVTATVESMPLICASIMSKKLAEGIDGLVLDVKFGSGAFMKTVEDAEQLALRLMAIAKGYGKKVMALLTNMNQPLGRYAGNSLEVFECVEILKNSKLSQDDPYFLETKELSVQLAAHMLLVGGYSNSLSACLAKANSTLVDGSAYQKFLDLCNVHGGDLNSLPNALNSVDILADKSGYIAKMNTEKIGIAGILLKAGRATAADIIEPTAGIAFHVKIGSQVRSGDKIFTLYGKDASLFAEAKKLLLSSVEFSEEKVPTENLIAKILA
jgi:pyrimidine-nucleoside phosphorylase